MKWKSILEIGLLVSLPLSLACSGPGEEPRGYAPAEAYLPGSPYPYFGSEGAWDRRFFTEETAADQYKRRGQRQMLEIVEGRYDSAIDYCRRMLESEPDDLESLFNLSVALAAKGQLEEALDTAVEAVDKGLPFERFQAGPRDLLEPLYDYPAFQEYAAGKSKKLIHGPMLGAITGHSARVWVRTAEEVPVSVRVSPNENLAGTSRESARVMATSSTDFTAVVEISDLSPASRYYYDVLIDGEPVLSAPYPSFRTYANRGEAMQFRVAFGGGAGYVPPHERTWDVIRSKDPVAMLLLGDNVYVDLPQMPNGLHYYTYYRRQSRPEFRKMVSAIPVYSIWDDHDSSIDDAWLGPYIDRPDWKLPLFRQFRENWNNPAYGDPDWPGCWYRFSIGDVDFFMLDGRFYRTNPYADHPTMLGPAQKQWLFDEIERSDGTFKVIVSPVPWSLKAKEAVDTWNGFQAERSEILNFLSERRIEGVFLLSADRHRSDAWLIERGDDYPLYEFESSRLTNQHVHELIPDALFGYNEKQSFGLLSFDTNKADPTVTYQIFSIDDELIATLEVKRSQLRSK